MYIKTGQGSKHILRNWFITPIFEGMKPYLRRGDVSHAVSYAVDEIVYHFYHKPSFLLRVLFFFQDHFILTVILVGALIYFIHFTAKKRRSRREAERQRRFAAEMVLLSSFCPASTSFSIQDGIRQHLEDPQRAHRPIFATSCPICMERFPQTHIDRMEQYV